MKKMYDIKTMKKAGFLGLSSVLALSGCATSATPEKLSETKEDFYKANNIKQPRTQQVIVHNNIPFVNETPIAYRKGSENLVDVDATGASLSDALMGPASAVGYSISFTSDINPSSSVNMQLRNVGAIEAIKKLAMSAGYHAIIDSRNHSVIISKEATWVFRVPPSIFDENSAGYDVGMSTEGAGGEGDSEDAGSSQDTSSSFKVSGQVTSEERDNFENVVRSLLARDVENSRATFSWSSGTITVTGDVFSLTRTKNLIDEMVKNALTQVEVQTMIAQVRLSDTQRYGINWSNILNTASSSLQASVNGGAFDVGDNPSLSATVTKTDIETIVRALAEKNKVSIMASPSIVTKNNRPATIFNGSKIPFLGKVESTLSSGTTSVSAESQYASDGLNLSVIPSALDNNTVSLKLVPSLTDVGEFRVFSFGNDEDGGVRLEVPETYQRQMFIDVTAQSGQTIILGGTRVSNRDRGASGIPGAINSNTVLSRLLGGVSNSDSEEELVVMVTTNVIPAPQYDSLVSESI